MKAGTWVCFNIGAYLVPGEYTTECVQTVAKSKGIGVWGVLPLGAICSVYSLTPSLTLTSFEIKFNDFWSQ